MLYSVLIAAAAFVALFFVGYGTISHYFSSLPTYAPAVVSALIVVLLFIFAGGFVFLLIASICSSLLWGKLSYEVEKLVAPDPPKDEKLFLFRDWLPRTMFTFFAALASLVTGWCGVIPVVFFAGWVSLYDYTSCYFARRGVPFTVQFGRAFKCKGWFTFALICGAFALVPLLNLALFPAMVAGATLMCAESNLDPT